MHTIYNVVKGNVLIYTHDVHSGNFELTYTKKLSTWFLLTTTKLNGGGDNKTNTPIKNYKNFYSPYRIRLSETTNTMWNFFEILPYIY